MKLSLQFLFIILYFFLFSFHNCFLFSVIIPIYNTGRYLNESIGSLLNQTIDFKEIQIILVNDGSTDQSEEICLKYKNKFPKNIIYIKIEHGGVSKARNRGMDYARGIYINFLDPDDKWDYNAFKYFLLFFEFYKQINFAAARIKIFEAENNYHPLDYKFYKTRIANLSEEYNCIQLSLCSSIFRKSLIQGHTFDERVFSHEDTLFINNILLHRPIIGLIREALFYYRRRMDSSSVVQSYKQNIEFYFDTLNYVFFKLINISTMMYNRILPFIQFLISYDILFRIKQQAFKFMDLHNFHKYCLIMKELLEKIEDKYILEQKILSNQVKIYTLSLKYNRDLRYDIQLNQNCFYYLKYIILDLNKQKNIIVWKIIELRNSILYLEGIDNFWMPKEKYHYFCIIENFVYYPKYFPNQNNDFITMHGIIEKGRIIEFYIPLKKNIKKQIIKFYLSIFGQNREIFTSTSLYSHIPPYSNGYYISDNFIIKYIDKRLIIFKYNRNLEIEFEYKYCNELQRRNKHSLICLRKQMKRKNQIKTHKQYEVWIINDRLDQAGGYGEYYFRYLKTIMPKDIKFYFVIDKNCTDYKKLKKLGNIIDLYSFQYLKILLVADKIFSSISDQLFEYLFDKDFNYISDLTHFEKIYLDNGIIEEGLSNFRDKLMKNVNIFVTSPIKEFKTILNTKYENQKKITNFLGQNNINKRIIVIPTWRKGFEGRRNLLSQKSIYTNKFVFSEYFNFYNNLINDKRLIIFMNQHNYKGTFCLHYFLESQWIDFNQNEIFSVIKKCDYQKVLLENSLLITDYSSIFFDFGYLKKPIIYTHFDYDEYRKTHYKKDYFDYNKDGFGPICKDINCTINEIIYEIKINCKLKKKYMMKVNKYFRNLHSNHNGNIFKDITKNKNNLTNKTENLFYDYSIFISFFLLYTLKKYMGQRDF